MIQPDDIFREALTSAAEFVDRTPNALVTFGIQPSYPAGVFGYIQRGERYPSEAATGTYRVVQFKEKPRSLLKMFSLHI